MATVTGLWHDSGYDADLPLRMRMFIWLSTGMFSAASVGLAAMGYFWTGTFENAASSFVASIVSGTMFGLACRFKFGPNEA
ncbi:MAG: hypothetical protein ACREDF_08425 [Thermoplasmata archaeon]